MATQTDTLDGSDIDQYLGKPIESSPLRDPRRHGRNGIPGKVVTAQPLQLRTAVGQIVNFLGTLQNEWAGAQAFSSFDTYPAP